MEEVAVHFAAHEVTLEVQMNENAPAAIQTYYLPAALTDVEEWEPTGSDFYAGSPEPSDYPMESTVHATMAIARIIPLDGKYERGASVAFMQWALPDYDGSQPLDSVSTLSDNAETYYCTIGETELACLYVPGSTVGYLATSDEWHYYWSDGDYIFCLQFGGAVDEAERAAIFESVAAMDDFTSWCYDSTVREFPPITVHYLPTYLPEGFTYVDGNSGAVGDCWYDWRLGGT